MTPRRRIDVPVLYSQEDVVRSELPDGDEGGGDLGEPIEGDSGRFVERNRATFFALAPFFSLRHDTAPARGFGRALPAGRLR